MLPNIASFLHRCSNPYNLQYVRNTQIIGPNEHTVRPSYEIVSIRKLTKKYCESTLFFYSNWIRRLAMTQEVSMMHFIPSEHKMIGPNEHAVRP